MYCYFFFFFKQKTAYEMRISDWSSDVCSSDLPAGATAPPHHRARDGEHHQQQGGERARDLVGDAEIRAFVDRDAVADEAVDPLPFGEIRACEHAAAGPLDAQLLSHRPFRRLRHPLSAATPPLLRGDPPPGHTKGTSA